MSIQIAEDISIKTWNDAVSNVGDKTLIDPNSALFRQAMVEKVIPIAIKSVSEILSPLNSRERALLRNLLKRIISTDVGQSA